MTPTAPSDLSFDCSIDVFSKENTDLQELTLFHMRSQHIACARALVAQAANPSLILHVYPYFDGIPDFDVWHLFDNVLFALWRKSLVSFFSSSSEAGTLLPLMSLISGRETTGVL